MTRPTTTPNPMRLTAALARQHPASLAVNVAAWP